MKQELIKKRFTKSLKTYNDNAIIQKEMAEKLISFLPKTTYSNVLELGCGTGFLTELFVKNFEYKNFVTVDIVSDCERIIKNINYDINFECADIKNYVKNIEEKFDLIISNATFQWIEDLEKFLLQLTSKLNNNGILLFSTFGENNFSEITKITGKTLNYKTSKEIKNTLKNYKCEVFEETKQLNFQTPLEVLKHLKNTGVNGIENIFWTKKDLKNFEEEYYKNFPAISLTYQPLYIFVKNSTTS